MSKIETEEELEALLKENSNFNENALLHEEMPSDTSPNGIFSNEEGESIEDQEAQRDPAPEDCDSDEYSSTADKENGNSFFYLKFLWF